MEKAVKLDHFAMAAETQVSVSVFPCTPHGFFCTNHDACHGSAQWGEAFSGWGEPALDCGASVQEKLSLL
jgi:hypothetical protein